MKTSLRKNVKPWIVAAGLGGFSMLFGGCKGSDNNNVVPSNNNQKSYIEADVSILSMEIGPAGGFVTTTATAKDVSTGETIKVSMRAVGDDGTAMMDIPEGMLDGANIAFEETGNPAYLAVRGVNPGAVVVTKSGDATAGKQKSLAPNGVMKLNINSQTLCGYSVTSSKRAAYLANIEQFKKDYTAILKKNDPKQVAPDF